MLEIAPTLEHVIVQRAEATGMTPDQYLTRLIAADPTPAAQPKPDRKALALIASIQRWQAEDATDDEDELSRRDNERAELHSNLDRSRHQAGMRPLFPGKG